MRGRCFRGCDGGFLSWRRLGAIAFSDDFYRTLFTFLFGVKQAQEALRGVVMRNAVGDVWSGSG